MKCKFCDNPATLKITPQAGGPVMSVCKAHAIQARKAVQGAKSGAIVKKPEGGFAPGKPGVNPFAKT